MADKWLCIVLLVGLSVGLHGMKDPKPRIRQCGRMETSPDSGHWPWIGAVQSADGRFIGVALLIDESFVLSHAARVGDYVVLGKHDRSSTQKIMVVEVIEPPNSPDGGTGHWPLVRLAHPVKFTKHVVPICLPEAGDVLPAPDASSKVCFKKYEG